MSIPVALLGGGSSQTSCPGRCRPRLEPPRAACLARSVETQNHDAGWRYSARHMRVAESVLLVRGTMAGWRSCFVPFLTLQCDGLSNGFATGIPTHQDELRSANRGLLALAAPQAATRQPRCPACACCGKSRANAKTRGVCRSHEGVTRRSLPISRRHYAPESADLTKALRAESADLTKTLCQLTRKPSG